MTYDVLVEDHSAGITKALVELLDSHGNAVATGSSLAGKLRVSKDSLHLWWPYTMSEQPGYLYTLKVFRPAQPLI